MRNNLKTTRFDDEELAIIERFLKACGLSYSEFNRDLILSFIDEKMNGLQAAQEPVKSEEPHD